MRSALATILATLISMTCATNMASMFAPRPTSRVMAWATTAHVWHRTPISARPLWSATSATWRSRRTILPSSSGAWVTRADMATTSRMPIMPSRRLTAHVPYSTSVPAWQRRPMCSAPCTTSIGIARTTASRILHVLSSSANMPMPWATPWVASCTIWS